MSNKNKYYTGNIADIRAVEDSIRITKKYTEGIGSMRKTHPVQGGDFPSKVFYKYYEVYPGLDMSKFWDMPYGVAIDWLWGDIEHLDVFFRYDYRSNKAEVTIKDGSEGIKSIARAIPGFSEALGRVIANHSNNSSNNVKGVAPYRVR